MNIEMGDSKQSTVTFARLPIFDSKKNLWGYELIYMSAGIDKSICPETGEGLTADLMSGTSLALDQTMDREKKIIIGFSSKNILENLPYALPPGRTVVKLSDPEGFSDEFIAILLKLKKDGYQITVPWIKNHNSCKAVYDLADMIFVDIFALALPDLTDICLMAAPYKAAILADQVNNQTGFDVCGKAGFTLFKGSFFKKQEDVPVKKVLSGTVSRFELMKAIEKTDPDFSELAATIQADVTISFRLLAYLNSASFGFRRKIDSIKDAVTILGWNNLKNWLRVVLLNEYVPLLKLARYFEEAAFEQTQVMIGQLGLDTVKVKEASRNALEWANKLSEMQMRK